MTSYVDAFTSSNIYASEVSQYALTLSANTSLYWPLDAPEGVPVVAKIMDVTASGAYSITLPPASQVSVGETILFNNVGSATYTVKDNAGNTLVSPAAGTQHQLYLVNNTTAAGVWRAYQFGAGTSTANAGSLVGAGIKAVGTTLNQSQTVSDKNTNYTVLDADRATLLNWTGGTGTFTLPSATSVGEDWFVTIKNNGSGALTVSSADLLDGRSSKVLNPNDSVTVVCAGTTYLTHGFGQSNEFVFDYTVIDVSGSADYTLSGTELNRVAYKFTGVLGADVDIIVPNTVQQYWVLNSTSGATLGIKTATQSSSEVLATGLQNVYFCDGADVRNAVTAQITGTVSGGTF